MDNSDHDPMEDLDAFLDEQHNSNSVANNSVAAAPAVAVIRSIFALVDALPEAKHLLLGKNTHIDETPKTSHTNANPDQEAFKNCVQFLEKHNIPTTMKYTKYFMVEFDGVEHMKTVYSELERNKCDMIGVCRIDGMLCCAFARRTLVKNPTVLHGVWQINGYFIFKNVGSGVHVNGFVVN